MNEVLRESLERGARSIETPDPDLDAVVARGEQRLRRRRLGAIGGTALAVALVIAAPAVVTDFRDEPRSVDRPGPVDPTKEAKPDSGPSRPIVYVEGSILHVGSRTIDIDFTPPFRKPDFHTVTQDSLGGLWATDEGAVFATHDGRIWFSDGTTTGQVGTIPLAEGSRWTFVTHGPTSWVGTDPRGPRAVWVGVAQDLPEVVVYDTEARRVTARVPLPVPTGRGLGDWELYGDHVYWNHFPRRGSVNQDQWMRTTLSTGLSEPATEAMADADQARLTPSLVVGTRVVVDGEEQTFAVRDSRLVGLRWEGDPEDRRLLPIRDPSTGEELRFSAPENLRDIGDRGLTLFSWLDDDQFVLSTSPTHEQQRRDIVVCRVSTERCEITERKGRGPWLVLPGVRMPG